jgi:hypothetical protein
MMILTIVMLLCDGGPKSSFRYIRPGTSLANGVTAIKVKNSTQGPGTQLLPDSGFSRLSTVFSEISFTDNPQLTILFIQRHYIDLLHIQTHNFYFIELTTRHYTMASKREIQRKKRMSEDEGYKQKRALQRKVSDKKLAKTPERIQYLKEWRKKRMSEDEGYKQKRALQKKVSDKKLAKTPERIQYLKESLEARNKPISKVLDLTVDALPTHHMDSLIGLFKTLLLEPWGSEKGIPIHTDAPGSCTPKCNISRPAVTRIHFGKQHDNGYRADYGAGTSSVGTDPRRAEIRVMTPAMVELGEALRQHMIENKMRCSCNMDLDEEFNSVTALLYTGKDAIPGSEGSSLGYHCDAVFGTDGSFSTSQNTQKERTPVVVVTLGDPRSLKMKKRRAMDGNWKDDKEYGILEFWLENGTIFVLHPDDEQPKKRATQKFLSQYQHGNVHVKKGLSLSLVFRVVTSKAKVCVVDNRKELQEKDKVLLKKKLHYHTKRKRTVADHHDTALQEFLDTKDVQEQHFRTFVKDKMVEWGWS